MDSPNQEHALDAALALYFESIDRGEPVAVAQLVAAYPQCARELESFFESEQILTVTLNAVANSQNASSAHSRSSGKEPQLSCDSSGRLNLERFSNGYIETSGNMPLGGSHPDGLSLLDRKRAG